MSQPNAISLAAAEEATPRKGLKVMAWIVFILGAMFYCYEYFLRIAPSLMTNQLMKAYGINVAVLGNLIACYYYIYTPMQLPVGVLMDRIGPRRLITAAILSCALGTYLFAQGQYLDLAYLGRFLVGFGSAFAFVGTLKLASIWFPRERFGFLSGVATTLGALGAMFGDIFIAEMVKYRGWQPTLTEASIVGVVLSVLFYIIIRDQIPGSKETSNNKKKAQVALPEIFGFAEVFRGMLIIFKNPKIWLNGLIGALLYLPLSGFAELWGVPFLERVQHLSSVNAASCNSMMFLGWALGCPLIGWVSDKLRTRMKLMTIMALLAALVATMLIYLPWSVATLYCLTFTLGVCLGGEVLVFPIGCDNSPHRLAGTSVAVTNMLVMLSGALFQPAIGDILQWRWAGTMLNGVPVYSASDYRLALIILPISLLIAALLSPLLRDRYKTPQLG